MNEAQGLDALERLLSYFWIPRENDEWPFEEWLVYCQESPEQAQILLSEVKPVIEIPPANLPEFILKNAQLIVPVTAGAGAREIEAANREWLRKSYARLQTILAGYLDSPTYALTQYLKDFWLNQDEYGSALQFQEKFKNDPGGAEELMSKLRSIAADPPGNLPELLQKWAWIQHYDDNGNEFTAAAYCDWFRAMIAGLDDSLKTSRQ